MMPMARPMAGMDLGTLYCLKGSDDKHLRSLKYFKCLAHLSTNVSEVHFCKLEWRLVLARLSKQKYTVVQKQHISEIDTTAQFLAISI